MRRWGTLVLVVCSHSGAAFAGEQVIPLAGEVPDDGLDHFFVPFEVAAGTAEIEIRHDDDSNLNVLDWGLVGPDGFRGWGGGNSEPAIVSEDAASRSYVPGPIGSGTWQVVVGKANIGDPPGNYTIEVVLRTAATLKAQTRSAYADVDALAEGPAWYAGDFHVHSDESGDARPPLQEIGTFARSRGLDFVVISDHNVHTAQDFFAGVQPDHPELLFVPGVEFTTYAGHANVVGATQWVDHKIGQPGITIEAAIAAYHDQGAMFSINHPVYELGALCIGCAWGHEVDGALVDAVEIASGGLEPFGAQFTDDAIAYWDALCAQGHHVAAIGGSDDHKAGVDLNQFQSPIGDATTLVYAARLDVASILQGVRDGRTVVKLQGPEDPTLMFDALQSIDGDTIAAPEVTLTAQVLGGQGDAIALVHNGVAGAQQDIDADPFEVHWTVVAPPEGQDRYRVEVFTEGERRVVSSHLWVEDDPSTGGLDSTGAEGSAATDDGPIGSTSSPGTDTNTGGDGSGAGDDPSSGCSCAQSGGRPPSSWALALLMLAVGRRRRPSTISHESPRTGHAGVQSRGG